MKLAAMFEKLLRLMRIGSAVQESTKAIAEIKANARKTGEQIAKLSDPQGKRIYHEVFVGDLAENGHYPWKCRVYHSGGVIEKDGQALSRDVAAAQAQHFAAAKRDYLEQQP